MWAGCIRGAVLGRNEESVFLELALERGYIRRIKEKTLEKQGGFFIHPGYSPVGTNLRRTGRPSPRLYFTVNG
jgi:hypothetical protein